MKFLAGALLFASLAPASLGAPPELPEGKWWKRPRLAAEINLTSDQAREIESIFSRARPELIDRKAVLEKKQGELQDALEGNADRRTVSARVEAVENARAELQKARILMVLDMKQVLKPDQWERLVRMREQIRERRMDRLERFRERRIGPRP
ncbi:MAG TPA: periplasmic heavy metal sensor [Thermoanaerobaculia bacterium]